MPVVLVETGFMSNRREAALLRSAAYQQQLAGALARGTQRFPEPVDHAAAPVAGEQPAGARLDREPERVLEAVGERRGAAGADVHLHELPAPALAQVLAPLGDDQPSRAQSASVFADECGSR